MLSPRHFRFSLDPASRVATITLDRPERKNPLTFESYAELCETFGRLRDDAALRSAVRAVVVTGAGENFSSGGDVHDIIAPLVRMQEASDRDGLLRFTRMTGALVRAMRACPQPVVAAIAGVCAGAGAMIATASDLRVGTARSRVAFLFVRVGLSGADMGACALLPRIVGQGRASELLFTGRFMSGDEAERWGFYNRLAAPERLLADAHDVAAALARGPSLAHAMTKRMLHEEWSMSVDDAIEAEARAQAECMMTQDFARAYQAFVEKRSPTFEGT